MITVRFYCLFYAGLCCLFLWQCKSENAPSIPDVSHIDLSYDIIRYDSLLGSLDTTDIKAAFQKLQSSHPAFTDLYFNNVVPISNEGAYDDAFYRELSSFLGDDRIRNLADTIQTLFPDFRKEYKPQYDQAFRLLKHYLPSIQIPDIYTLFSEYAYQHFLFPDGKSGGLGVGLDMYFGQEFDYKRINPQSPSFSDYLTRTFNEEHILRKSVHAILEDYLPPPRGNSLLDLMIHNGK